MALWIFVWRSWLSGYLSGAHGSPGICLALMALRVFVWRSWLSGYLSGAHGSPGICLALWTIIINFLSKLILYTFLVSSLQTIWKKILHLWKEKLLPTLNLLWLRISLVFYFHTRLLVLSGAHGSPGICLVLMALRVFVWRSWLSGYLSGAHGSPGICLALMALRVFVWRSWLSGYLSGALNYHH